MEELKCKIGRVWNYSSISSMYQNSVKQCRVSKWKINQRLTLHFKVPRAVNHRICINLAHIPPSIQWLYSLQMQKPLVWRWSWKWNSWISSYHVVMDCKYSLSINTNPCNLQSIMVLLFIATTDSKKFAFITVIATYLSIIIEKLISQISDRFVFIWVRIKTK